MERNHTVHSNTSYGNTVHNNTEAGTISHSNTEHTSYYASLKEICEEKRLLKDRVSGRVKEEAVYFSSMEKLIRGACSFVEYFEHIHKNGYVYGSHSPDHFRFSLKTGQLLQTADPYLQPMTGEAAAAPSQADPPAKAGLGSSQSGTAMTGQGQVVIDEFLAPELVEALAEGRELTFSLESDWYFMSVFLFEYFFHTGSPFEGKKMVNRCFLSPMEKELYRVEQGQFCMSPDEQENPPVKGIQDKLIKYWDLYPPVLHRMFQKAFMDAGKHGDLRPSEIDWKHLLVQLLMDVRECPCGFKGFSFQLEGRNNGTLACPGCGKLYYPLTNGIDRILLTAGGKLYACQTGRNPFDKDTMTGLVVENKRKKGLYGIKNISRGIWTGMYPDRTIREIGQGGGIPIWDGMRLKFELGEEWSLQLTCPSLPGDSPLSFADIPLEDPDKRELGPESDEDPEGGIVKQNPMESF